MDYLTLHDVEPGGKRVLVRVDFNVPLKDGYIEDDTRIRACIPTINQLLGAGAKVMLMSHLGRPEEGKPEEKYSLAPVAVCLATLLGRDVPLISNWREGITGDPGDISMLENVRFEKGEKANDDELARSMAALCDVFVNDAFATAHRAQASTHGVAKYARQACAGPLLTAELTALSRALEAPERPMTAIVGGSKVSTKLTVLETLLDRVDQLIVGGGIANTFLLATGHSTGQSLCEPDLVDTATHLLNKARDAGKNIPLPVDVVCGTEFNEDTRAVIRSVTDVGPGEMIMDVGPVTAENYSALLNNARTIVWNGPLGVFEFNQFSEGTRSLAQAIAGSDAFSIAGGGDTLSAISKFDITDDISYISTGGGAFLELLEGKELPAVAILKARSG